jgi:hypothetical protein
MRATPYFAFWATAVLLAIGVAVRRRSRLIILKRDYWRWLLAPWRLTTFAIATTGLVVVAPLMRDPFWDRVDASFMSVLTFATAPWAIGSLWRAVFRNGSPVEGYVALCAALFSASWSFDLYQAARLGFYPDVWWLNLLASSSLYVLAGVFFSLDGSADRGTTLAFLAARWPPRRTEAEFRRILWPATLYMLAVSVAVLAPFVWSLR